MNPLTRLRPITHRAGLSARVILLIAAVAALFVAVGGLCVAAGVYVARASQPRDLAPSVPLASAACAEPAPAVLSMVTVAPPAVRWADRVRAFSTQYTEDGWSAARALGPPDATSGGDDENAWASASADDQTEFLELGFAPGRASAVEVVESFNPGAVSRVTLILASGAEVVVHADPAVVTHVGPALTGPGAARRRIEFACTAEPVVAVRVTVDSVAVADWNEIDAVGLTPCS